MGNFMGGSAYAMANQIAEGYLLLNANHMKKLTRSDINELKFELDRIMKDTRGDQPPLDQIDLLQKRNRKISRINNAVMMLNHHLSQMRGG